MRAGREFYESETIEMPTIHRENGFILFIYPGDHGQPHVHVLKAGGQAKIFIGAEGESPTFDWVSEEMSNKDARRALELVRKNKTKLLEGWRRYCE
jgi:hypothetical protein